MMRRIVDVEGQALEVERQDEQALGVVGLGGFFEC